MTISLSTAENFGINNIKKIVSKKNIRIVHRIRENIWRTTTLQMLSGSRMYFLCERKRKKKRSRTSRLNSSHSRQENPLARFEPVHSGSFDFVH